MGVKQAEPRLQLKKHRRVSRKKMNQSILDDIDAEMDDPDDDHQFGVSRRAGKR
jgi:ribosome biogenesis GTPase